MTKLDEFIAYLEEQVQNHSIYVWSAQGQAAPQITKEWIYSKETSSTNANRALYFWQKQVAAGYGDKLRAFDCSGLAMYWLQNLKHIATSDMSANSLKGKCAVLSKANLHKGDWVFRCYADGSAYHIGYVVDDQLNVIESKGRDDGVVKRAINASGSTYWTHFGRPSYFKEDIEALIKASTPPPTPAQYTFTRLLKLNTVGDDVKYLQGKLKVLMTGQFNATTKTAVLAFQKAHNLEQDGVVGPLTVKALGDLWKAK